jgi:ERCC4-type nuclease
MSEGSDEVTFVVDINEPEEIRMLALSHPDVDNWKEVTLDAADIVVNGVGIERKRPGDFAASMLDDRLDEQIRKLNDAYEEAVILIEGNGFADFSTLDHTRLNPQSARGKAASTHMRYGIPVVPTGGTPGTQTAQRLLVDYAIRLGRKATEEPTSDYLASSVVGSDEPLGKRAWGCFEDVGPTRAEALYGAVGSPLGVHPPSLDELRSVDGIGWKTAQSVREQFPTVEAPDPSSDDGSPAEAAQGTAEGSGG